MAEEDKRQPEQDISAAEQVPDKQYTTIEWETDTEKVRIVFYVERFPKTQGE